MTYEKLERFIDLAIKPALIALVILIALELLGLTEQYEPIPTIVDVVIIAIFVLDLWFKWKHTKNWKVFFKLHWLEVIAVMPFYLFARVALAFGEIVGGRVAVDALHALAEVRETRVIEEVRTVRALRGVSIGTRIIRLIAARLRAVHHRMMHHHLKFKKY